MKLARRLLSRKKRGQDELSEVAPAKPAGPLDLLPVLALDRLPIAPDQAAARPTRDPPPPFFKLPYELRHQIHCLVLGGREIHLDIAYTAVVAPGPHTTAHARLSGHNWRWRPSTCHRSLNIDAAWDRCLFGGPPTDCAAHDTPCCIGMLSWLLTCRQVYLEGIEVLFTENTLHVMTGAVLLFPRQLLVPQAVFTTALVVRLSRGSVIEYAKEHLGLQKGWPAYRALVDAIPRGFPHLRTLYLVVEGTQDANAWEHEDTPRHEELAPEESSLRAKAELLGPVDRLVREYRGQLDECHLVIEKTSFDRFLADDLATADTVQTGRGWRQLWRPVQLGPDAEDAGEVTGYWVRRIGWYIARRLVAAEGDSNIDAAMSVEIVD